MNGEPARTRHPAHIASLVPGRLRLKLHRASRDAHVMHHIKSKLESREGIQGVRVNPSNGSVTVHYDHTRHGTAGILAWLEDLDVMVESIGHLPSVEGGEPADERGFLAALEDLNRRIRGLTGIPIDLKLMLPLLFVGAGVWSTIRKGLMIEAVPGWLFLWFAFDMFVKLHPYEAERKGSRSASERAEEIHARQPIDGGTGAASSPQSIEPVSAHPASP